VATDTAPPPRISRTRVYSLALVVATAAVVTFALLLPVLLNTYAVLPPASPSAGPNVQVNAYAPGTNWTGQFGDDPAVAVAPNGTIAVAWEGLNELAPPSTPGGLPTFDTVVFVSYSYDQGQRYSTPQPVGSPGTSSAFEPALAFAANGTLFLAYANATNSVNQQILVMSATPGEPFGPGVAAQQGEDLGRPWLFVLASGTIVLAFEYDGFAEWTVSTDGGRTFQASMIASEGLLTGATVWDGDMVTLVGLALGALTYPTTFTWSVTFDVTGSEPAVVGAPAILNLPYPVSIVGPSISRPGPSVASSQGVLYLVYSSQNESKLTLETSNTNGSSWAGPWTLWASRNTSVETPVVEAVPGSPILVISWESTEGGHWGTYVALYDVRTGLLSSPTEASATAGFPASVRNWHGTVMGLAVTGPTQLVVVWGDGRGLDGTYGLTQIYACTLVAQLS
jgi:hypothetical protein